MQEGNSRVEPQREEATETSGRSQAELNRRGDIEVRTWRVSLGRKRSRMEARLAVDRYMKTKR